MNYPEEKTHSRTSAHDAYFSEETAEIYRQLPIGELQERAADSLKYAAEIQEARFDYIVASNELLRRGVSLA